jgi:hypothetical protein
MYEAHFWSTFRNRIPGHFLFLKKFWAKFDYFFQKLYGHTASKHDCQMVYFHTNPLILVYYVHKAFESKISISIMTIG